MNQIFIAITAFAFGTIIGSFLNVVIWRLPRQQSLGGRSHCPHCGYTLKAVNLLPVISYVLQGGSCVNCNKRISARYPLIEVITGMLFAAAAVHSLAFGINALAVLELLRLLFVIAVLVAVFVIDLEHYLILDVVIFPAVGVTLVLNLLIDLMAHKSVLTFTSLTGGGVAAALLAAGFFYVLWRVSAGKWMGFGDVKLNIFLGLVLGFPGIAVGLFLAFMIGSGVGLALIALKLKQLQSRVPFGTFLSIGAILALFYGHQLAKWYASLIGWR